MRFYKTGVYILMMVCFASCKKDPVVGGTAAEKMANEWWVMLTQNGTDIFRIGHFHMSTYNTSANDSAMWIDDEKNGYGFKSKVAANFSALTFSSNTVSSSNVYYDPAHPASFPQSVKITEGKVLANAAHSKGGNLTDSIYMKIEFSDDPGQTYVISGYARTRFAEDDY